jgi:hypothetical protein
LPTPELAARDKNRGPLNIACFIHRLFIACGLALLSHTASAAAGVGTDIYCPNPPVELGGWRNLQCEYVGDNYSPPGQGHLRPPVMFIWWANEPGERKVTVDLQGDPALSACVAAQSGVVGELIARPCMSHWPDQNLYAGMQDWWGAFGGTNSAGWRIASAIDYAQTTLGSLVAPEKGIALRGSSAGATAMNTQTPAMATFPVQQQFVTAYGSRAFTLFFKQGHIYSQDPATQNAWAGFDISTADWRIAAANGSISHIYYAMHGGKNDYQLGAVDTEYFALCDQHKIACFGTWDQGGHTHSGEVGVNLPRSLYAGALMDHRLDRMQPVFTQSTANSPLSGLRGHYNLGLSADMTNFADAAVLVSTYIRYLRHTNMGADLEDQPTEATFTYTLRRFQNFELEVGEVLNWQVTGTAQSGTVTVTTPGEITIPAITLPSSHQFWQVLITKPGSGC